MSKANIEIVVAQRGWVFVGCVEQEGNQVVIRNGFTVRRWGTKNGLGELAAKGPLSETKLDAIGETKIHELAVVARIACSAEWEAQCKPK